jgi:hypothetical protein
MMRWLMAALWMIVLSGVAQAHLLPKQNATMNIVDKAAFFVVAVPVSALTGVDDDGNGTVSLAEIQTHNRDIQRQFEARFRVSNAGIPGQSVLSWVLSPTSDGPPTDADYVVVMHRANFTEVPANPVLETDLFGTGPGETQMTVTATLGTTKEVAILQAGASTHTFFRGKLATFVNFTRIGIEHIWSGADHLLFLLTILIVGGGWRYWLGVVTSFTVAHSITLALSSLGILRVPANIIEPGVAASIVIMALANIWFLRGKTRPSVAVRVAVVFGCGLLHGFGFASAIGAMAVDTANRLATLAGFNVGIEIGQFLFVGALALIAGLLARTWRLQIDARAPQFASAVAAGLGLILFVQRIDLT